MKNIKFFFKNYLNSFALLIFCALILFLSLRGIPGNPSAEELNSAYWREDGPLEQTGRFALLYSVIEDGSFHFSVPVARFATPDLGIANGNYVSLFAPGLSFIGMPGYLAGKYFGFSQAGTFATISLFALLNVFLIRGIAMKMGAGHMAAGIGGLTYIFATPAFSYAVDFFQHHVSVFFALLSIFSIMYFRTYLSLIIVFFCCGLSIVVDYPNFLLMLPIGVYALTKIVQIIKTEKKLELKINPLKVMTLSFVIFPTLFLLWFNQVSNGNAFYLSGSLERIQSLNEQGLPETASAGWNTIQEQIGLVGAFNPREMIRGLYVHFLSPDRGIISYAPVIIFGIAGMIYAMNKRVKYATLLGITAFFNIFTYSMWTDPWGGWSFGSRYLIPSYAIFSIFIGYLIYLSRKRVLIIMIFFIALSYSTAINTLGALTSSLNPPQVEAEYLETQFNKEFKYTYENNIDFLSNAGSKSLIFNMFFIKYMSPWDYYIVISVLVIFAFGIMLFENAFVSVRKNLFSG